MSENGLSETDFADESEFTDDDNPWSAAEETLFEREEKPDDTGSPGEWTPGVTIMDAPDYGAMLRGKRTVKGRAYEAKVQSVLKSAALAALRNKDLPDAAVIFKYGPSFAMAAGDSAAQYDSVAKAIDLVTMPDSPIAGLLIAGAAMIAQFARNNEETITKVRETRKMSRPERKAAREQSRNDPDSFRAFTINGPFGRKFTVRLRIARLAVFKRMFSAGTKNPGALCREVYSDDGLQKALLAHKIRISFEDE
jgi:hypothetical protein